MPPEAAEIARRAREAGRLGIDTEFMGEGRYRPELCLVQVSLPSEDPQPGDVRLRKTASFTRWDRRPLSPEQLEYAREDVLHLLALAEALQDRLRAIGRLGWAREECAYLEGISDERDLDTIFGKLPRVNSLDPGQRAVARELVEWREGLAERGNRPVSSVLQDATLVEVAKRRPQTSERLSQIRGLHESTLRRRGREILQAVARGRAREGIPGQGERPTQPDPTDAQL